MRAVSVAVFLLVSISIAASTNIVRHHRRHSSVARTHNPLGNWMAATPADCRSPCPALNILANHGLIPRDGRNIDLKMLQDALINVYGLSTAFGTIFAHAAVKKFAVPATGKVSLCDLLTNIHINQQPSGATGIEHSASLSRDDRPKDDWTHASDHTQRSPSQNQINVLLGSSSDKQMITLNDMVTARGKLWDRAYTLSPALKSDKLDNTERIIANTEACLLLGALAGKSNQGHFQITTAYAQSILFEERLPVDWAKSPRTLGLPELFECLAGQGLLWAKNEVTAVIELSKHWLQVDLKL